MLEFGEQTKQGPVPFTVGGTDDNAGTEEEANPGMRHPEEVAGIFFSRFLKDECQLAAKEKK